MGTLAAANAWNPLGWGLAAGLAGAAGAAWLSGGQDSSEEARLTRANQRGEQRRTGTPDPRERRLDRRALHWDGEKGALDTPHGPVNFRSGWGNKPFISTNRSQYPHTTSSGTKYSELVSDQESANPGTRQRARATWHGITHLAEEARTPGAAKFARATERAVAMGRLSRQEAYTGSSPAYTPALRPGGTEAFRQLVADPRGMSPSTRTALSYMSDSSDDED